MSGQYLSERRGRAVWAMVALGAYLLLSFCFSLDYAAMEFAHSDFFPRVADESAWVRGAYFGYPWRLTQRLLAHDLLLTLFEDNWLPYLLLSLLLHPLNGFLCFILARDFARLAPSRLQDYPQLAGLGAFLAGLFFTLQGRAHAFDTSTNAYRLVVLFCLLALIMALRALGTKRLKYWCLSALAYGLALFSHLYALALPAFIFCLELAIYRGGQRRFTWRSGLWRYLIFALSLLLFMQQYGALLFEKASYEVGGQGDLTLREILSLLPWYLRFSVEHVWASTLELGRRDGLKNLFISLSLIPLSAYAVFRALRPPGRVGVIGLFCLFFVAFSLLAYPITLGGVGSLTLPRRYAFNGVGVGLFLGLSPALLLAKLARPPYEKAVIWGGGSLLALSALTLAFMQPNYGHISDLKGIVPHLQTRLCPQDLPCATATPGQGGGEAYPCEDYSLQSDLALDFTQSSARGSRFVGTHALEFQGAEGDFQQACFLFSSMDVANFQSARLNGAHFGGASLVGASFRNAELEAGYFKAALLSEADFRGATVVAGQFQEADLQGADLRQGDFRRGDFRDADLTYAQLEGADFNGANLQDAALCEDKRVHFKGMSLKAWPMWVECPPLH